MIQTTKYLSTFAPSFKLTPFGLIIPYMKNLYSFILVAVRTHTGTQCGTATNIAGRFLIPAMRIGGLPLSPYHLMAIRQHPV